MSIRLEEARNYQDLLDRGEDERFVFPHLFRTETMGDRALSRKRFGWLKVHAKDVVGRLRPEERVYFLTRGVVITLLDFLTMGWLAYLLNRRLFVFTTQRILILFLNASGVTRAVAQVDYGALRRFRRGFLGGCQFFLESGCKISASGIPRRDQKVIEKIGQDLGGEKAPVPRENPGLTFLCHSCSAFLPRKVRECGSCGQRYKSRARAGLLSFAFPGLGDLYLRHPILGGFELFVATVMWIGLLAPDPDIPFGFGELFAFAIFIWLFMHGLDALHTLHMGSKMPLHETKPGGRGLTVFAFVMPLVVTALLVFWAMPASLKHSGILAYKMSDYETSRKMLHRAQKFGDDGEIHQYLAFGYEAEEDFQRAESHYLRCLEKEPENEIYHYYYADMLSKQGRYEESLEFCEKALALDADFFEAWQEKGVCLYRLEQFEEARIAFEKTVELDDSSATAWSNLAYTYQMLGLEEEAGRARQRAEALAGE